MKKLILGVLATSLLLTGCASTDHYYKLQDNYLKERQLQTKRFETENEESILVASAQVLQDLGYTLTESQTKLGLITGSKDRDATNGGQVAGAILLAALTGARMPLDVSQKVCATLVSTKSKDNNGYLVRIKFARVVFNDMGGARIEMISEPQIYQDFFKDLSQSVFLTANDI